MRNWAVSVPVLGAIRVRRPRLGSELHAVAGVLEYGLSVAPPIGTTTAQSTTRAVAPIWRTPAAPLPAMVGEQITIDLVPAPASVFIRSARWLIACAAACGAGIALWGAPGLAAAGAAIVQFSIAIAIVVLVYEGVRRRLTRFVMSDRRIAATTGVIVRVGFEVGPAGVRHIAIRRSLLERLFGLGTIAVATAGAPAYEVVWWHISAPETVLAQLRAALNAWNQEIAVRVRRGQVPTPSPSERPEPEPEPAPREIAPVPSPPASEVLPVPAVSFTQESSPAEQPAVPAPDPPLAPTPAPAELFPSEPTIPVIGLAGGIGAGKSFLAQVFEQLGCYVVDSDARAKAALDRLDVRDRLLEWWGEGVLDREGRVDRAEVARIVFANPDERRRLEALVHPIVRQERAQLIKEAEVHWPRAIIVDAPLLFEAGVDKECDAVVFVEAPFEERLARVSQTRGWDEAELRRRESAQWPLEQKRALSQYVLENVGPESEISRRAEEVLDRVRTAMAPDAAGSGDAGPDSAPES